MMHIVSLSLFSRSSTMPLTSIDRGYTTERDISKPSMGPTCSQPRVKMSHRKRKNATVRSMRRLGLLTIL